jgi:hypothetical protein
MKTMYKTTLLILIISSISNSSPETEMRIKILEQDEQYGDYLQTALQIYDMPTLLSMKGDNVTLTIFNLIIKALLNELGIYEIDLDKCSPIYSNIVEDFKILARNVLTPTADRSPAKVSQHACNTFKNIVSKTDFITEGCIDSEKINILYQIKESTCPIESVKYNFGKLEIYSKYIVKIPSEDSQAYNYGITLAQLMRLLSGIRK